MGALNRAGFELAAGDWIFLLNDDVAARKIPAMPTSR